MRAAATITILAMTITGCVTATWHDDLMSNAQLMQADCQALRNEEQKLADNAKHTEEAASFGKGAAFFVALLEGAAAAKSGTTTTAPGATQQAALAENAAQLSRQAEERRQMV